jgi:hypothetical protein
VKDDTDLRDMFAAFAMQGMLAGNDPDPNPWQLSRRAYQYADAIVQVREETDE